jgi:uncharacterized protein
MKFNILDFLLPRETKFYDFFKEQVNILIEASHIFRSMASRNDEMNEDDLKKEVNKIKDCEKKGDMVESKIIKELNLTFITPFDREDIHMIATNIDLALDILTSISNKMEIYGINRFPKSIHNFAELIVEISELLYILMEDLEAKKNIDNSIKNIHALENKADYLFYISVADLFKSQIDPIDVIKLKDVYEYLEDMVDAVDHVGKIVRRIMIKQG